MGAGLADGLLGRCDACAVDDHAQALRRGRGIVHRSLHGHGVAHVAGMGGRAIPDLRGEGAAGGGVTVEDDDAVAPLREPARGGGAEAGRPACDEC